MPKVKTSSKQQNKNELNANVKQLTAAIKQLIEHQNSNVAKEEKDREKRLKEARDAAKKQAAEIKEVKDKKKEDQWQAKQDLKQKSVAAERRRSFGQAAIGTMLGIDPAVVSMLGIDKLGANLWNSKFGWNAQKKRHEQKIEEEKLNEEYGITKGLDPVSKSTSTPANNENKNIQVEQLKGLNDNAKEAAGQRNETNRLLTNVVKGIEKLDERSNTTKAREAHTVVDKNGTELSFDKKANRYRDPFGKFGKPEEQPKEKYGSVVNDKDENTKLLRQLVKNTSGQKTSDGKAIIKEEKKDGGIFSKIFGVAKKSLIPIIVGMIANAFRGMIKNGIANLLGGGEFGEFMGGAIADFFPGAVAGLAYAMKNRAPIIPSALIGGTISFAIPRIRRTIDQIIGAFSSDQDPNAGNLDRYAEKAMTGAMIGASITGWRRGSLKAAALGAGIGLATEFILARVDNIKAMLNGEPTEIKTIAGIPEAAFGGMLSGAMIGLKFGGFKGAMLGALIGGGAGLIWSIVQENRNRMLAAKNGQYVEPKTIFGVPYKVAAGLIGGASIGFKFAGLWPGLVLGALIGGLAGFILQKVEDYTAKSSIEQKQRDENFGKVVTKTDSKDATNSTDYAGNRQRELEEKKANGGLSKEEEKELEKIQDATYRAKKRVTNAMEADTNGDGFISPEELAVYDKEHGGGIGGTARSVRQMREVMKQSGGKGFSIQDLSNYQLQKEGINVPLQSTPMATASQINENSEEQLDATKKTNEYLEKIAKAYEDPENLPRTNIVNNNSAPQQTNINPYSTDMTAAGLER